jgi:HEAT repeat protein
MQAVRSVEVARACQAATPAILEALRDNYQRVRPLAAVALAQIDQQSEAVIPALREVVAEGRMERRVHALAARFLPEVEPKLIGELVADLSVGMDADVRGYAAHDLGLIGPKAHPAAPALVAILADKDQALRLQAADTLVRIGRPVEEVVLVLIEGLRAPDDEVRLFAARSLAAVGPGARAAIEALDEVARTDPYGSVRQAAIAALGSISTDATARPSP